MTGVDIAKLAWIRFFKGLAIKAARERSYLISTVRRTVATTALERTKNNDEPSARSEERSRQQRWSERKTMTN
jgi:hypothetical protein